MDEIKQQRAGRIPGYVVIRSPNDDVSKLRIFIGRRMSLSIQSIRKIVLAFPVRRSYVADQRYLN